MTHKKRPRPSAKKTSREALLAALAPPAPPAPRADKDDLVSAMLFNTGPYPADGQVRTVPWYNPTDRRLLFTSCELWAGLQAGMRADVHAHIFRWPDSSFLCIMQWDHYAEPAAPVAKQQALAPYMALEPGEALVFQHFAAPFNPQQRLVHFTATLWWRYGAEDRIEERDCAR